jgi:hypothetical protein
VGVPALRQEGYYEAYTNHWVAWRAACVTGLAAFPLDSWRMVMKYNLLSQEAALRAFGVGYIDLPARDAASSVVLQPLLTRDSVTVYRLRRGLGRAFTVPYVLGVEDDDAAARAMSIPGFDPGNAVVVSGAQGVTEYRGSRASRVTWAKDGPDSLVLVVDAPDSTFLVVADSYFPGWKATIDDRPVPIRKVNLLVRGVEVPAGRHEVTMTYETVGSKLGVALTRLGLALWAGLALWTVFVAIRRRSPATPAAPG